MIGTVIISTPAAYGIARKKIKGVTVFLFVVLIIQMFPSNMMALPLFAMFTHMRLTDTYLGVILANMTISIPFCILVLRTFFLSMPKDLENAALIDGCTNWGTFFKIILPLSQTGITTCATFSFLFAWGEFIYSLILLNSKDLWPITVGMRGFVGQHGTSWGELMAISVVSSLPIILIFVFTLRYIISGITAGAVKE